MVTETALHRYQSAITRATRQYVKAWERARREYEDAASMANSIPEDCPECGHLRAWHGEVGCKFRSVCGCDISLLRFGNGGAHGKEKKEKEV